MKFTNGFWLSRKGVNIFPSTQVRDWEMKENRLTLYVSPTYVTNRGQTLGGPLLTIRFSSPLPGILRISATHFDGEAERGPAFPLNEKNCPFEVAETEERFEIKSGNLTATIEKSPFRVSYFYNGRSLVTTADKPLSYITAPDGNYMREQLVLDIGEKIYGLGERFTPFVKNGQSVDIWNKDGGTSSEQTYKNIPFYLSSKGYGVFVNSPDRVSYEVASESASAVQFSVPGEKLDYKI